MSELKERIEFIIDNDNLIIETSKKEDIYGFGDVTFIFNCAVYELVKSMWEKNNKISLVAENPTGRGGYSDITIRLNGEPQIEIEHENNPKRIEECIDKLAISEAEHKLLITYHPKKDLKKSLDEVKNYVNNIRKNKNKTFKLCLLYSDDEKINYLIKEFPARI